MTAQWPDDRSDRSFLQVLDFLHKRLATEPDAMHGPAPLLRWAVETSDVEGEPKRSVTAQFDGFRLLVVEMGEAFLAGKPLFLPQVSWCLGWGPEPDEVRVGGPAPTFEDAKARAELALRVQVRAGMDS